MRCLLVLFIVITLGCSDSGRAQVNSTDLEKATQTTNHTYGLSVDTSVIENGSPILVKFMSCEQCWVNSSVTHGVKKRNEFQRILNQFVSRPDLKIIRINTVYDEDGDLAGAEIYYQVKK